MKASFIEINLYTNNAAFEDNQGAEVARILRKLADSFDGWQEVDNDLAHPLHDYNGNKVGHLRTK
jgi:hypothetical protein